MDYAEEEENNAPDDVDDDGNHNSSDLFCEEVEEVYGLCSGFEGKPSTYFVQPCGHMICSNCLKRKNWNLCGCQKPN